jgi:GTP pyrophosphokinase
MVQVREQSYLRDDGSVDGERWLAQLPVAERLSEADAAQLRGALRVLRDSSALPGRDSSDWAREADCERAGLETAQILAELEVDRDCLIAGLLYRAVREERLKPAAIERALRRARRQAAARRSAHGGDLRPAQSQ